MMRAGLREVNKSETVSLMQEKRPKAARPRQRRAMETRAGLLAAVEAIVAAEGPDAVTTTRVAAETGAAVGTIYRYFSDRDAMLLAAYDATVDRLVDTCRAVLDTLPGDIGVEPAARRLLGVYIDAAEAIPAHSGLLAAMQRLRPVAVAQSIGEDRIVAELVGPFLARFAPALAAAPVQLQTLRAVLVTLVDLYLVTPDADDRAALHAEIGAHVVFMLGRLGAAGRRDS